LGLLPSRHGNRKVMRELFAADARQRAEAKRRAVEKAEGN
jgi:hypothetical protein